MVQVFLYPGEVPLFLNARDSSFDAMKILLLNPPAGGGRKFIREGRCTQEQGVWATLWPPLSLASIGAVLENDHHQVSIIDCPAQGITLQKIEQVVCDWAPAVVIWSTGTPSIEGDLELASSVKKWRSGIITAVFGTHVTALDKECMRSVPELDVIVRNEPELTVSELVGALSKGEDIKAVKGITFRTAQEEIISNPARPFIDNLDSLPFPAWHLLEIDRYRLPLKGKPFLMISPLRGCPFHCSFCTCHTYYGNKLRTRTVESVLAEIAYNQKRFAVNDYFFWAETFVVDKHYVSKLCSGLIERNMGISWTANSRVDTVDAPLLALMARAGCWMISYGIESASQKVLDEAGKGTTRQDALEAVRATRQAGIKSVGHFILGLPGETRTSIEETIAFAQTLQLDLAQFYCAVPFPGSRLYDRALKEGWITPTQFSVYNQDSALMNLPSLPPEVVSRYRTRAYKRFYANPVRIARALTLVNWKDIKGLIASARAFWGWSRK